MIDEKPKKDRSAVDPEAKAKRKTLPPISRLNEAAHATSAAKAAPAPVAPPVEAPKPRPVKKEALDLIGAELDKVVDVAPEPETAEPAAPETNGASAPTDEKIIQIKPPIIVKDLAEAMGIKPFQLIKDLMELSIFANINQTLDTEIAIKVCEKHGFVFEVEKREKGGGFHKQEEVVVEPPPPVKQKEEELQPRPPVITFMGHVDHGKTSLMDAVRKTRVAAGEAGGITQHIGAYSVEHKGHKYTFLDTPGHQAFTAMRARGAQVTDIVVLVVAADDGLMPQTIEAINHAKAAGVSIVVAINKIDLPSANIDKVKTGLQNHDLTPEDWGGETICVPVSATKGTGIDELLEMIALQAEVLELKSNPAEVARATVIEAQMEPGRGPTATVIIKMGTLRPGAAFICGSVWGKVKAMLDHVGAQIKEAGPAVPCKLLGFSSLVNAGDELVVMENERAARQLSEERVQSERTEKLAAPQRATFENLFEAMAEGQRKVLRMVLKADVQGSLEALISSLGEIKSDKIDMNVIHSGVGPISDSDVLLASASDAVIVGFNVKVESAASTSAKREGVQIKLYSIIYELLDQVKEAMAGMLDPELRESVIGHAVVKKVFDLSRGTVAGCQVSDGRILRTARARVLRGRQPIYDGGLATLKRFQDDVKEVRSGLECGIRLGDFTEYEEGDVIECYLLEKVPQQL
jgi:translation initiation factor IF-2